MDLKGRNYKRIVLPGMGATSAMYQGPWLDLDNTHFIDWPTNLDLYTLDDLTDWCCSEFPEARIALGSSLGGMIALKVASRLKMSDVVLIGSAVSYSEIRSLLIKLQPLAKLVPFELLQLLASSGPTLLSSMYSKQSPELIRQTIEDLPNFQWHDDTVRIHRIHGINDPIIKCPDKADLLIEGGHLIALTHPEDCCRYLLQNGL